MAIAPCSSDFKASAWDGVALAFLTTGLTALAVSKIYKPDLFATYKLPAMSITTCGTVGGYAVGRIVNWPKKPEIINKGRFFKHQKKIDQWSNIRPDRAADTPNEEHQATLRAFLKACSAEETAAILFNHSDDAPVITHYLNDREKMTEALEILFAGDEGFRFLEEIRGPMLQDMPGPLRSIIALMKPETLAAHLDKHPDDTRYLIKGYLETGVLEVIGLLTTREAMDQWITSLAGTQLPEKDVKRLFRSMCPNVPAADVPVNWKPEHTPAFERLLEETERFNCYCAVETRNHALVVATVLGKERARGEYLATKLLPLPKDRGGTPTTERALGVLLGPDRLERVRGIVHTVRTLLVKPEQMAEARQKYLRSAASTWQRAYLYSLDEIFDLYMAKVKPQVNDTWAEKRAYTARVEAWKARFKEDIQATLEFLTAGESRHFADILFGEMPPAGWLTGVAKSLTRLDVRFGTREGQLGPNQILGKAKEMGIGADKLTLFLNGLRSNDHKVIMPVIESNPEFECYRDVDTRPNDTVERGEWVR